MSRAEFTNWAVDEAGNVVASAAFEVRWRSNASLVTTVYDAASGVGTVSNPGTATSGGLVNFWLPYGEYEVTIGAGASAVTIPFDAAPATGVPRSFATRAAAATEWAAMVARSETPPVGTVWTWPDASIIYDGAGTLPDLSGWEFFGDANMSHIGAVGDGSTDDLAAFTAAAATGRVIDGLGRTYKISGDFALVAGTVIENCTIDCTSWADTDEITLSGGNRATGIALTANADAGDTTLTMGDTSSLAAGDYLVLSSSDVWSSAASVNIGEIVQVASVDSGTVVSLEGSVALAYTTADSAQIEKLTLVEGAGFRNVKFIGDGSTQKDALRFTYGLRPVLEGVRCEGFVDNGVALVNCVGLTGTPDIESSDMGTVLAYAVNLSGCASMSFGTITGRRLRHAFTVGGTDFPSHDITVREVIGEECIAAPADTHAAARNIHIEHIANRRSRIATGGTNDALVMQGANISIGWVDLSDCAGRIGALFQPHIDFSGDWYLRAKGVVSNPGTTGVTLDIQGTAGLSDCDLDFRVINPSQYGFYGNIQDGDVVNLSLRASIQGHTSDIYEPVRIRTYASTTVNRTRLDLLSATDDDTGEHVYLLADAASPLANVNVTGLIENGSIGVRGTNVSTGTVNVSGLMIIGCTTDTSGL